MRISILAAAFTFLLTAVPAVAQTLPVDTIVYPWDMARDFHHRIETAELVVSGTIVSSAMAGTQTVDRISLTANLAELRIDRNFKGEWHPNLRFTWFSPGPARGGVIYSGPPLADFRPGTRYLVFLRKDSRGWVVSIPLFAYEMRLAHGKSASVLRDLSQAPVGRRDQAIAEELEAAALLEPVPQPGLTGWAPRYFPPVYDLIGGCADPFYRRFLSSPSKDLRAAAERWIQVLRSHKLGCRNEIRLP